MSMIGCCAGGAAGPPVINFAAFVSSIPVLAAYQTDLGVTQSGGTMSVWADQTGNGNVINGAGTTLPGYTASGLNGFPTISLVAANQNALNNTTLTLPTPGTAPTFYWFVFRQDVWASNRIIISATGTTRLSILQNTATPQIGMQNTTVSNLNSGAPVSSWARGACKFTGSTSDYLKLGASKITGASAGNSAPSAGFFLGRNNGTSAWTSFSIAALLICQGEPNTSELAALDSAVTSKYGAGVLL
jgi:hypothetical protein